MTSSHRIVNAHARIVARQTGFDRRTMMIVGGVIGAYEERSLFTAVFEQDGDWWVGSVEELPGANTQGPTLEEARENLQEAGQLSIEANRE